ncbi:anaerobic sulfite reductase subunit AsrA [Clostridium sardiniense]|uniref:Anaerobic sulfite reductase subunit AsrA n=1 Tax=Clostridium sardiniense TaxID=29369 RepID=A0ABS7L056_CLOSR|nr:anaerobic sulfite reductase subunit AsrA [Clostridium sardiniense]MBY0756232.1 anaerobic sulfite reductase subunit AsrA [Clostridium sardiniense]MDQ0458824.1 anaerobic sulfite reductase subunit A [Clostridium sardiniense]
MGFKIRTKDLNSVFEKMSGSYKIVAPIVVEGAGRCSETDIVRYDEVKRVEDIEFNRKSDYSYKEALLPITQTILFFTQDEYKEPVVNEKPQIIFVRSCDLHGVKRVDDIYLRNGFVDPYYKKLREGVKFVLIGCEKSFDNCYCVDMETNKSDNYDAYLKVSDGYAYLDIKDDELKEYFNETPKMEMEVNPDFVTENKIKVNIPENLTLDVMDSKMWDEYSERCIACGRCNFVCPTCTCNTMQDIYYSDNENIGERRRVWASCQVPGYTTMAGGHEFRKANGQKMRFKIMHKVYDYKKRWGYHMCVGCGRCDDICPEYISVPGCINKLQDAMDEVNSNDK